MTYDFLATKFSIRATWPSRREHPNDVAYRLRRFFDTLADIDSTLAPWSIRERKKFTYQLSQDGLAEIVRHNVMRDEFGKIEPDAGYGISCLSGDTRQLYSLVGCVGGIYAWRLWNRIYFTTCGGRPPDPLIVTYEVVKALTLATITCWEPAFCRTGTSDLLPEPTEGWYSKAWITYVPAVHAAGIDLVSIPFSERTPEGGLLLSATNQVFDAANLVHLEGARRIAAATRHLNPTLPSL